MVRLLSRNDVIQVLEMADCIDALEKAFTELANGTADLPLRTPIKPPEGLSLYMPAYLREMNALACKVVTVYKNNPAKHNMPTTIGTVLLQDAETGQVICIMDGGYLTAVRTGAVSGLATRLLAREKPGPGGGDLSARAAWRRCSSGPCARRETCRRRWSTTCCPENAQKFKEAMEAKLGIPVEVAGRRRGAA